MSTLLVVHHALSPATHELLEAVLVGARDPDIEGVDVGVRAAPAASLPDMLDADGYLFGTTATPHVGRAETLSGRKSAY